MNNLLQNYAILKSNWLPSNPIETFKPIFIYFLNQTKINNMGKENLKKKFSEFLGFNINHYLLDSLLQSLIVDEIAVVDTKKVIINYDKIILYNYDYLDDCQKSLNLLYNDFISRHGDVSFTSFEQALIRFVDKYDNYIFVNDHYLEFDYEEPDDPTDNDILDYFLMEYIKMLYKNNNPLYEYIMQICQGSLVKGYISYEIPVNAEYMKNKECIIDTPVLLRILGFCNEYYKNDYTMLYNKLIEQGASLYIYDITFNEVYDMLESCEQWIDNPSFDISKSSELLIYFINLNSHKIDITEEMKSLKNKLDKLNIGIIDTSNEKDEKYWGIEEIYKEKIEESYFSQINQNTNRKYDKTIEHDAKALALCEKTFSNNINDFEDHNKLFITSNSRLIDIYKNKTGIKFSPVIKDSILGVMICKTDINSSDEISKLKLLSFCFNSYKLSQENKNRYMEILHKGVADGKISEKLFALMRNSSLIPEKILEKTKGNNYDLDEPMFYDIVESVKKEIIPEFFEQKDQEIKKIKEDNEALVKEINETNQERLDSNNLLHFKNNYEHVRKRYNSCVNRIIILKSLLIVIFAVASLIAFPIFTCFSNWALFVIFTFLLIISIFSLINLAFPKINVFIYIDKKILNKKLNNLKKEFMKNNDFDYKVNEVKKMPCWAEFYSNEEK